MKTKLSQSEQVIIRSKVEPRKDEARTVRPRYSRAESKPAELTSKDDLLPEGELQEQVAGRAKDDEGMRFGESVVEPQYLSRRQPGYAPKEEDAVIERAPKRGSRPEAVYKDIDEDAAPLAAQEKSPEAQRKPVVVQDKPPEAEARPERRPRETRKVVEPEEASKPKPVSEERKQQQEELKPEGEKPKLQEEKTKELPRERPRRVPEERKAVKEPEERVVVEPEEASRPKTKPKDAPRPKYEERKLEEPIEKTDREPVRTSPRRRQEARKVEDRVVIEPEEDARPKVSEKKPESAVKPEDLAKEPKAIVERATRERPRRAAEKPEEVAEKPNVVGYANGEKYQGDVKDNKREGKGNSKW
eukprot:TRINITY_DN5847_c0_g1_i10.p2 TRINITY_DN5847_c0_g1~~TRINITY_DN5847_c0_g1_i10.p2  ORF type:complete len:359 (+),score=99.33 TRINITY_DN5847_c0_g1_i10:535-1611(+)